MDIKNLTKNKKRKRVGRARRSRAKLKGTAKRPRLCVFRSNRNIWAQLIDDKTSKTLASAKSIGVKKPSLAKNKGIQNKDIKNKADLAAKCAIAFAVGKEIAQKAKSLNIAEAVFDRGACKYHGRVKALADGARSEGLKF